MPPVVGFFPSSLNLIIPPSDSLSPNSYAYDDLTEAELYDDIHEYGGVLPWFLFDVYATHWALGAMVVGITGFFALIGTCE